MKQQRYDRTFYIAVLRMRMRVQQVPGDPWTYELTPFLYYPREPTDIIVRNQFEFDKILADLHLVELEPGRRLANFFARFTGLEKASAWYQKRQATRRLPSIQPVYRMRRLDAPPE